MTLYRAAVLDVPGDPFAVGPAALAVESDARHRGPQRHDHRARGRTPTWPRRTPTHEVVDLRDGLLLPGLVDTHVHYPQVRVIAGLGMPLLDWLERCALPEESRLAEDAYAEAVAGEFLTALAQAGTTTALVFGAHFATAMDIFFAAARRSGLRITAGQVVSDRILRPDLLTTPEIALAEGRKLIERWHGDGRLRYAVTPRFSLSASEAMLDVCAELTRAEPDVWFTSHMNENTVEVARVVQLFAGAEHYLGSYYHHGLVTPRSVFAHNVHANDIELDLLASTGAWVAHCPTSNAALGSGLFPMRRHVEHGARVAMGSDVGGGTGFSMFKEGLQAYFMQQLLGPEGLPLTRRRTCSICAPGPAPRRSAWTRRSGTCGSARSSTRSGCARRTSSTLAVVLRHASDAHDALAKIFALATATDVARVWVGGEVISPREERAD